MSDEYASNFFKSLWTKINAATVAELPEGQPPKAVFMMETPGFSIDPERFNPEKFDYDHGQMHPDRAVALLADRVPALAPYFYDTGSHISFYWKQLLESFQLSWTPEADDQLKAKYKEAIRMLYGDEEGYIKQMKTELFQQVEPLRTKWQEAMKKKEKFWEDCKVKGAAEEFQSNAGPVIEEKDQAYTEYDLLKSQIQRYEAAIFQYTRGDLSRLLLQQAIAMEQNKKYDAEGGSGIPFYVTQFQPEDWWKWFKDDSKDHTKEDHTEEDHTEEDLSEEGWTLVESKGGESSKVHHETFSKISPKVEATNIPLSSLFNLVNISVGGSIKAEEKKELEKAKNFTFSFKVRKVLIHRPWLEVGILKYPTIGIRGLKAGAWSTGELDVQYNTGQFPVLPTAMVLAKDITIEANDSETEVLKKLGKLSTDSKLSVGCGPFCIGGNLSGEYGSKSSKAHYQENEKRLKIEGVQVIGWICAPIPYFPWFDAKDISKHSLKSML